MHKSEPRHSWRALIIIFILTIISAIHLISATTSSNNTKTGQLNIGRAINLFSRYGYLSISMRVVPRNDSEVWLFREPTVDVFQNVIPDENVRSGRSGHTKTRSAVFQGDFHMEFCDNVRQLLHAYFRDFHIEKLDKPWRAFTGSWSSSAAARELGINSSFVNSQSAHSFILVRVARWRETNKMIPSTNVPVSAVAKEIDTIEIGNESSVMNFIRSYGSHYVSSYVTGNSLYQVCYTACCLKCRHSCIIFFLL